MYAVTEAVFRKQSLRGPFDLISEDRVQRPRGAVGRLLRGLRWLR
jgi:hypothetical protein